VRSRCWRLSRGRRGYDGIYGEESLAIGAARVGGKTENFVSGTLKQLCDDDEELGGPLHSLVLLGRRTHELESEYVREYAPDKEALSPRPVRHVQR
jgi:diphthine synthase